MGKKMDDEISIPETPRSTKSRKGLSALPVTPNSGAGARSVDSRDGNNNAVSPRGNTKSPHSVKSFKVDCNSPASISVKGGSGSPKNGESDDPEYVNADITADELRQIEQVLRTSEPRLQELYKKVGLRYLHMCHSSLFCLFYSTFRGPSVRRQSLFFILFLSF